jgi:GT2 family glycosyltransferase
VRASVFHEVGGLDEELCVAFNDIDLCLRVREAGYRNLWTPFAELYHYESATRGYENTPEKIERFKREESFMQHRWKNALNTDPYYNPNFTLHGTPFTLAYPPRLMS